MKFPILWPILLFLILDYSPVAATDGKASLNNWPLIMGPTGTSSTKYIDILCMAEQQPDYQNVFIGGFTNDGSKMSYSPLTPGGPMSFLSFFGAIDATEGTITFMRTIVRTTQTSSSDLASFVGVQGIQQNTKAGKESQVALFMRHRYPVILVVDVSTIESSSTFLYQYYYFSLNTGSNSKLFMLNSKQALYFYDSTVVFACGIESSTLSEMVPYTFRQKLGESGNQYRRQAFVGSPEEDKLNTTIVQAMPTNPDYVMLVGVTSKVPDQMTDPLITQFQAYLRVEVVSEGDFMSTAQTRSYFTHTITQFQINSDDYLVEKETPYSLYGRAIDSTNSEFFLLSYFEVGKLSSISSGTYFSTVYRYKGFRVTSWSQPEIQTSPGEFTPSSLRGYYYYSTDSLFKYNEVLCSDFSVGSGSVIVDFMMFLKSTLTADKQSLAVIKVGTAYQVTVKFHEFPGSVYSYPDRIVPRFIRLKSIVDTTYSYYFGGKAGYLMFQDKQNSWIGTTDFYVQFSSGLVGFFSYQEFDTSITYSDPPNYQVPLSFTDLITAYPMSTDIVHLQNLEMMELITVQNAFGSNIATVADVSEHADTSATPGKAKVGFKLSEVFYETIFSEESALSKASDTAAEPYSFTQAWVDGSSSMDVKILTFNFNGNKAEESEFTIDAAETKFLLTDLNSGSPIELGTDALVFDKSSQSLSLRVTEGQIGKGYFGVIFTIKLTAPTAYLEAGSFFVGFSTPNNPSCALKQTNLILFTGEAITKQMSFAVPADCYHNDTYSAMTFKKDGSSSSTEMKTTAASGTDPFYYLAVSFGANKIMFKADYTEAMKDAWAGKWIVSFEYKDLFGQSYTTTVDTFFVATCQDTQFSSVFSFTSSDSSKQPANFEDFNKDALDHFLDYTSLFNQSFNDLSLSGAPFKVGSAAVAENIDWPSVKQSVEIDGQSDSITYSNQKFVDCSGSVEILRIEQFDRSSTNQVEVASSTVVGSVTVEPNSADVNYFKMSVGPSPALVGSFPASTFIVVIKITLPGSSQSGFLRYQLRMVDCSAAVFSGPTLSISFDLGDSADQSTGWKGSDITVASASNCGSVKSTLSGIKSATATQFTSDAGKALIATNTIKASDVVAFTSVQSAEGVQVETLTLATRSDLYVASYVLEFQVAFIDTTVGGATGTYELNVAMTACTVQSLSVSGQTLSASTSSSSHQNGIPIFKYEVGEVAWVLNSHTTTITQTPACGYGPYTTSIQKVEISTHDSSVQSRTSVIPKPFSTAHGELMVETGSNQFVGLHFFVIQYALSGNQQATPVSVDAIKFGVEITKKGEYPPEFTGDLNSTVEIAVNEERSLIFPTYTYYGISDGEDTCRFEVTGPEWVSLADDASGVLFAPVVEISEDSTLEKVEGDLEEILGKHTVEVILKEGLTGLSKTYLIDVTVHLGDLDLTALVEKEEDIKANVAHLLELERAAKSEEDREAFEEIISRLVEESVEFEPVRVKLTRMSRDGIVSFGFNQKLAVPDLSKIRSGPPPPDAAASSRRLEGEKSLGEIISIKMSGASSDFQVELSDWTKEKLEVKLVFANPLSVSPASRKDVLQVEILDPSYFKSEETGLPLDLGDPTSVKSMKTTVPKQLPEGVVEEELVEQANLQENSFKSILIIQLAAAIFLNKQKDKLWVLICALQVIVYMPIYKVDVPANLDIFLEALRKIAEFKVVEPKHVLNWVGMEDLLEDKTLSEDEKVAQEEYKHAGFESFSLIENMFYFIVAGGVFILAIVVLLLVQLLKKYRRKIQKKLRAIIKQTFWNGILRSFTMTYLKSFVAFALATSLIDWNFHEQEVGQRASSLAVIASGLHLVLLPFWSIYFLLSHKDELEQEHVRERYESLYLGIKIKNAPALWFPMLFQVRRIAFVMFAIAQTRYPFFQIQTLNFMSCLYFMYIGYFKPNLELKAWRLELMNEFLIQLLCYHFFCFTEFVNAEAQYVLGQSFVFTIIFLMVVNLLALASDLYYPIKLQMLKKQRLKELIQIRQDEEKKLLLEEESLQATRQLQEQMQAQLRKEAEEKLKEWLRSQEDARATETPSPGVLSLRSMISEKVRAKVKSTYLRKQEIVAEQRKKLEGQPVYKDELTLTNQRLEAERQERLQAIQTRSKSQADLQILKQLESEDNEPQDSPFSRSLSSFGEETERPWDDKAQVQAQVSMTQNSPNQKDLDRSPSVVLRQKSRISMLGTIEEESQMSS